MLKLSQYKYGANKRNINWSFINDQNAIKMFEQECFYCGFYDINKEVLEKWKESIDVLNLEQNVGLSRGTNLGVYNAKYDKILIVNDDNVFPYGWDEQLEKIMQNVIAAMALQLKPAGHSLV